MKHVFIIHSNVVLLSALGAINYLKLEHSNVLFLYGRNFNSSIVAPDIESVDISSFYFDYPRLSFRFFPWQYKKYYAKIDSFVDNIVHEEYEIYVPHFNMVIYQVLMTNEKCLGANILQEGAYSFFNKPFASQFKVRLLNIFFSSPRRWFQCNWSLNKYAKGKFVFHRSYAVDKQFFAPLKEFEQVIIKWPVINDERCNLPEGSNVFLFESAVELGQIEKDVYFSGCRLLIENCGVDYCFVKFHPNQSKENISSLLEMFGNIKVTILPDDIPFELTLVASSKLTLYGFTTSLLKFGEYLGHRVIRKDKYLKTHSKKFAYYCAAMN